MYIEKACPVYNQDILNIAHKRENVQKERVHAEQQIKATLDEDKIRP